MPARKKSWGWEAMTLLFENFLGYGRERDGGWELAREKWAVRRFQRV